MGVDITTFCLNADAIIYNMKSIWKGLFSLIGILGVVPDGKYSSLWGWPVIIQCLAFSNCFVRGSAKMYWFTLCQQWRVWDSGRKTRWRNPTELQTWDQSSGKKSELVMYPEEIVGPPGREIISWILGEGTVAGNGISSVGMLLSGAGGGFKEATGKDRLVSKEQMKRKSWK